MKVFIGMVAALLAATSAPAMAGGQEHNHPAHGEHADHLNHASPLVLDHGGAKWKTDTALRDGMTHIRSAVHKHGKDEGRLAAAQGRALANDINTWVGYMIANCKLEPKADAALHVLIGDLVKGAELLQAPGHAKDGLALAKKALATYPQYFDHPDWH